MVVILVPTLVLCYLGLSSISTERQALDTLAGNNARLTGERLADAIEARAFSLAGACLHDPDLAGVDVPAGSASPSLRRALRRRLESVRARHPIARALVLLRDGSPIVPEPADQFSRRLDRLAAGELQAARAAFDRLFAQAQSVEVGDLRPADAQRLYEQASALLVSDERRALALEGLARCAVKSKDLPAATRAYQTLLARFPDQYNLSNWPYGVVAALELHDLNAAGDRSGADPRQAVLRDLIVGRWELTAESANYLRGKLADTLDHEAGLATGPYLEYLGLANLLQRQTVPSFGNTADVLPVQLGVDGQAEQLFYARVTGNHGSAGDLVIGLVVDLAWVKGQLWPSVARDLAVTDLYRITGTAESRPGRSPKASAVFVPFNAVFPFWTIEIPPPSTSTSGGMLLFAGAIVAVIAVLMLGVVLLVRDASREASLARLRSGFVSGVSHELKTPLTLIRMYGEMLHDDPDAPADERQGYSRIITRESDRLTRLIDRVLDFSRAERGTRKYTLAPVDFAPMVEATIDEYAPFLQQKGFVVERRIGEVGPVSADADAVREAIVNLLDNAAKYSGDSREIAVRVSALPGEVVTEVRDRGIGIDEKTRACLFQPFARGDHGNGTGGYGLGLYLVKHIMDAHGGRVEVDTAPGEGSSFRLVFPAMVPVDGQRGDRGSTGLE